MSPDHGPSMGEAGNSANIVVAQLTVRTGTRMHASMGIQGRLATPSDVTDYAGVLTFDAGGRGPPSGGGGH